MKKKYKTRFPMSRIKRIMQTDEEVGKVALATPILISKTLELFMQNLIEKTAEETRNKRAKTMSPYHLKECIRKTCQFDFLKDVVASVAEKEEVPHEAATTSAPRKRKIVTEAEKVNKPKGRGRGRPRVTKQEVKESENEDSCESGSPPTPMFTPKSTSTSISTPVGKMVEPMGEPRLAHVVPPNIDHSIALDQFADAQEPPAHVQEPAMQPNQPSYPTTTASMPSDTTGLPPYAQSYVNVKPEIETSGNSNISFETMPPPPAAPMKKPTYTEDEDYD